MPTHSFWDLLAASNSQISLKLNSPGLGNTALSLGFPCNSLNMLPHSPFPSPTPMCWCSPGLQPSLFLLTYSLSGQCGPLPRRLMTLRPNFSCQLLFWSSRLIHLPSNVSKAPQILNTKLNQLFIPLHSWSSLSVGLRIIYWFTQTRNFLLLPPLWVDHKLIHLIFIDCIYWLSTMCQTLCQTLRLQQ